MQFLHDLLPQRKSVAVCLYMRVFQAIYKAMYALPLQGFENQNQRYALCESFVFPQQLWELSRAAATLRMTNNSSLGP